MQVLFTAGSSWDIKCFCSVLSLAVTALDDVEVAGNVRVSGPVEYDPSGEIAETVPCVELCQLKVRAPPLVPTISVGRPVESRVNVEDLPLGKVMRMEVTPVANPVVSLVPK